MIENSEAASAYSSANIRSAMGHFLSGKLASAAGGFVFQILIAREMATDAYAVYAVMFGLINILGMLSGFGMQSVTQRFIPEVRTRGQGGFLAVFTSSLVVFRVFVLGLFCLLLYSYADLFASFFGLSARLEEVRLWMPVAALNVLFFYLNILLESFVMQRVTKWFFVILMLTRLILIAVYALVPSDGLTLMELVWIEIAAFGLCASLSLAVIIKIVVSLIKESNATEDVTNVKKRVGSFALFNYMQQIVIMLNSQGTNRLIAGKFLSSFDVATFGFAAQLNDIFLRYLPSMVFRNLLNPALMARYAEDGDSRRLNTLVNIIYKMNFFVLAPAFIFIAVAGNDFMALLSKGKYSDSDWLLFVMLIMLVVRSNNIMLETHANASEKNQYLFKSALVNAVFFIPTLFAVQVFGAFGLLLLRLVGMLIRDIYFAKKLCKEGIKYKFDIVGTFKIAGISTFIALILKLLYITGSGMIALVIFFLLSLFLFLVITLFIKPFTDIERKTINNLIGQNVFIW